MVTAEAEKTKRMIKPNKQQQKCIEKLDGPVMVLAGPGTGKTFTLIERIKYMLKQGIEPESILCLTYSEAAASEMKVRLVKEVGTIASVVSIHTYHAFCNEIIKNNPADFELMEGLALADDMQKQDIMAESIKECKPVAYVTQWGNAEYFITEHLKNVAEIKKSQITKEKYMYNLEHHPLWQGKMDELEEEKKDRETNGKAMKTFNQKYENHKRKIAKAREAWDIFEVYNRKLKEHNLIDFDDMILMVLNTLNSNEELLDRVSKKYKYFLVDEYQDTNYAQNNIVFKLAEGAGNKNIFVVGDDDQIIYEFQGAKTDTLEKFLKRYENDNVEVICLEENNRSTQTILDFSYKVISQDETRLEFNPEFKKYKINKKLTAKNPDVCAKDRKIKVNSFAEITQEQNYIVEDIEKLIKKTDFPKTEKGEPDLSTIAILTRQNSELESFADLLKSKNIKFQIKTTRSIFELKPSLLLYFYLKALFNHSYYSEQLFGLLGSEPFAFEAEDYSYLLSQNRLNHKDFVENIRLNKDHDWKDKEKVLGFLDTYDELKKLQAKENLKNLIVSVCNKTGLLKYYVESDVNKTDNILAIKKIIDLAGDVRRNNRGAGLGDFIKYIDMALERNIPLNIDKDEYTQNAVQLVTLHSSKGRQFDYVYMPNLVASNWERKNTRNNVSLPIIDEDKLVDDDVAKKSEQLRLLFVGLTRTKYDLTLSYANNILGRTQELTTYLSDVINSSPDLCETATYELTKDGYATELLKSFRQNNYDYEGAFKDELEKRVEKFILSPSSLNQYTACPRNFLYTYILRIPIYELDWDNANYGSSVHAALEHAEKTAMETGSYPTAEEMVEDFKKNLGEFEFEDADKRNEFLKRGAASLKKYYPHFIETSADRLFEVEATFDAIPIDGEIIKGKIDRIEKNSDGTFRLYDFKTGSSKPHKQISDGGNYENYLNQLRFYKLAFETVHEGSYVSQTGLLFPEAFEGNFYIKLTDEDNKIIKEKIMNAYREIKALNFKPCDDEKACEHCSYAHLCKLDVC